MMWKAALFSLAAILSTTSSGPVNNFRPKVIVDVDVGTDDAMALLMLLSRNSPVNVVAITCVTGNTGMANVTKNVFKTLTVANRLDIPVYEGSKQGLVYYEKTDGFWGDDGLGDFNFPHPLDLRSLKRDHSAEALVKFVKRNPGQITVLALGPLTNIALATHLYPDFLRDVRELVILGGSYKGSGNVKPGVEFNFYADPESASFVFSMAPGDHPITIVPMETVECAAFSLEFRLNILGGLPSPAMRFLNQAERKGLQKVGNEWSYFDPLAAAVVMQPDIVVDFILRKVHIETHGTHARGAMLVDHRSNQTMARIITQVDKEKVRDLMMRTLS